MISRALVGAALVAALAVPSTAAAAPLSVAGLTANRQTEPLGLGDARPSLGWTLSGEGRGREQTAYQVIVSKDGTDVWDSGEVHSAASANVAYGGPALQSGSRYTWKVRAWDESGQPSAYSAPASLETGLLSAGDWTAKWIAAPADDLNLNGDKWIWYTNDDAVNNMPALTRFLRATVTLPAAPTEARFLFTVDDEAVVFVNGTQVIDTKAQRDSDENAWQKAQLLDVTSLLHAGANTIAVQVKNRLNPSGGGTPGGFIARLKADSTTFDTSSAWKSSTSGSAGWEQPAFNDTAWTPARELATYGSGPWGGNVSLPPQPSPYLRKDFTATKPDRLRAALRLRARPLRGPHQRPEGRRPGARARAGRSTRSASRRRPTTSRTLVKQGDNAIGAVLGDGFYAGRLQGGRKWGTNPALLAQLKITYADGTTQPQSPPTTRGRPAAAACRRRASTTARPTTPASTSRAGTSRPSTAAGRARSSATRRWPSSPSQAPPIKVLQTLKPVKRHAADPRHLRLRPRPELRRLGAAARPGRARARRSACASARSSTPTARSTPPTCAPPSRPTPTRCAGTGTRRPTSRASPTTASATSRSPASRARRRSTRSTAAWSAPTCPSSAPSRAPTTLVNQIQSAIRWGQRSNFLAVPTDASQRDERLGWTGDIQAFASTAAFNGDASGFLGQWMQTLRDSQTAAGAFPDVAPVTCCGEGTAGWGDAGTVVPWALYRHYGDTRILQANYDAMKRWIAYLQATRAA